jgi:hypothetical protein
LWFVADTPSTRPREKRPYRSIQRSADGSTTLGVVAAARHTSF